MYNYEFDIPSLLKDHILRNYITQRQLELYYSLGSLFSGSSGLIIFTSEV